MTATIELSNDSPDCWTPDEQRIATWMEPVLELTDTREPCTISLRFVDETAGAALNEQYRGKPGATNVLSFPAAAPTAMVRHLGRRPLGDIVICPPVVQREAGAQGKEPAAHWAHLLQHGLLHLLGYDHADRAGAEEMESIEIRALERLGIKNPYLVA